MTRWTYEKAERVLNEFVGSGDPSDPKERKRTRIVRAATDLFIRLGYRRTSVDEIAREAGVAKGTVYLYFKTKAELLMHAIAAEKRRYFVRLEPILSEEMPPRERLRAWLRLVLVLPAEMPLVSRLLRGDREVLVAFEELEPGLREWMQKMQIDFVTGFLEAVAPEQWTDEELAGRGKVLLGLVYLSGLITDERIRGGLALERFAEILADILVDGVDSGAGSEKDRR